MINFRYLKEARKRQVNKYLSKSMYAKKLELNAKGRDFVVSDLHGHFSLFDRLLREVAFNPSVDRVISVGDLIDRGPESERCLHYLMQPWFHAVRGNHEDILINALDKAPGMRDLWMRVGGSWAQYVDENTLEDMANVFFELPYAIEIETPMGSVGIVHADFPLNTSWPPFFAKMTQGRTDSNDLKLLMWSRDRFNRCQVALEYPGTYTIPAIEGIHRVYVGHNVVEQPTLYGNLVYIDTGVYCGGSLTAVNLNDEEIFSISAA